MTGACKHMPRHIVPIIVLILALAWFDSLDIFMSNLDENESSLLPLSHIVLITTLSDFQEKSSSSDSGRL